jgi:hypothetical protein
MVQDVRDGEVHRAVIEGVAINRRGRTAATELAIGFEELNRETIPREQASGSQTSDAASDYYDCVSTVLHYSGLARVLAKAPRDSRSDFLPMREDGNMLASLNRDRPERLTFRPVVSPPDALD